MEIKIIEIRDRGTYIPVMAIKMQSDNPAERYHLRRLGYGVDDVLIMVVRIDVKNKATYAHYDYNDRTMSNAHRFIEKHYDELESGDVIDVEFILGETTKPKKSENMNIGQTDMVDFAAKLMGETIRSGK